MIGCLPVPKVLKSAHHKVPATVDRGERQTDRADGGARGVETYRP